MQKHKFTVVTQLHEKNNQDIITYIESSRHTYAKAVRETFYALKNSENFNKSSFYTYLQNSYNITRRTANSIVSDAQGRFNSLKELKQYEAKQLEHKISYLETQLIPKLVEKRNNNSKLLQAGMPVSLIKQRNLRLKIVAKKKQIKSSKTKACQSELSTRVRQFKTLFWYKEIAQTRL